MGLIAIVGPIASGKSTLAREIAAHGFEHLSIDSVRDAGGDWPEFIARVTLASKPTVTESVALPKGYLRVLDLKAAVLVCVTCPEHVRRSRLMERGQAAKPVLWDDSELADFVVDGSKPIASEMVAQILTAARA